VLKVTSQSGSVLITGDIEKDAERDLLSLDPDALKSDVIIVPHHGSKTSSTPGFIEAVSPSISIFTPGYLNRYKHPRPEVIERYQAANSLLYRSDYNGAIEMRFINHSQINHSQVNQDEITQSKIHLLSWRDQYKRYWQSTF
jgi:competence protein ComEC